MWNDMLVIVCFTICISSLMIMSYYFGYSFAKKIYQRGDKEC